LLEVRSLRAQIKDLAVPAAGALAGQVRALDQSLGEILAPPPDGNDGRPADRRLEALNADLASLYGQVTGADAAPTTAQSNCAAAAVAAWRPLATEWERLKGKDIAVLNVALRRAGRPLLRAELAPPHDADQADLE
jgi:hypothetical protein